MKRSFMVIVSLYLVMVLAFVGCGQKPPTSKDDTHEKGAETQSGNEEGSDDSTAVDSSELSEPGEFPIVEEKVTLDVLIGGSAQVEDFNTNDFTEWYEEKTNVHVNFDVLPVKDGEEKLNLILLGGDYPEVLMDTGITQSQIMIYGSQGMFLPLNDLIEEHGYEIKRVFKDSDTAYVEEVLTNPDGNIYALPDINQCYHCSMNQKLWIHKPWLDKLGLEIPKTLEEYRDTLITFKNKDPNGNDKADEIPLASEKNSLVGFFMNSFIYCDNGKNMILDDGKIDVTYNKDEWREGLAYLKGLYDEGLISSESFTQDWDQLRQAGENPDEVILGSATGLHMGMFTQFYGESGRWLDYVAVPPLQGYGGKKPTAQYDPYQVVSDTIITDKCKNPELALKWVDGMYEFEAVMRSIFGRPGEEWAYAEDGDVGINGEPAIYKLLIPWSETVQNITWAQVGPHVRSNTFRMGEAATPEDPLETLLYQATKQYEPYVPDQGQLVPPLIFTEEQANELAELEKTIDDYLRQMTGAFITGDADLNTEWDSFVQSLNDMNLERYIEIYQEAYNLKYKNN